MTESASQVVLLQPKKTDQARQGLPQFFGISQDSAGAQGISMNVTAFGPGGKSKAHYHRNFETAIYAVSGNVALFHGQNLEFCDVIRPGCFCYIPAFVPHVAFNLSDTEPAISISSRNDAREQENVILQPQLDGLRDEAAQEMKRSFVAEQ